MHPPQNVPSLRFVHFPIILILFFGSGCAALIYEVVWFQLLQLVIGLTSVSLGLLLGVFMAGLCIGSLTLPYVLSNRFHPLRVYAALEFGIAIFGILIPSLIPWLADFYSHYGGAGVVGTGVRGVIVTTCLLPPTFLMGATLPVIARWVGSSAQGITWLGFFYGGNIAGAVMGCLLAGFYLLRLFDMATASYVAAAINVAVALIALAVASKTSDHIGSETTVQESGIQPTDKAPAPTRPVIWLVSLGIAFSGFTALGAEVIWTRLLSLLMGGTVYTFSIILAVFLIGLGAGSSAGAALSRSSRQSRNLFFVCQFLLLAAVTWSITIITKSLPHWPINPSLSQSPWYNFQIDILRCFWAIFPPTLLWGASFPLALGAVRGAERDGGKVVGRLYAANTLGAIFGALFFSLILIPSSGTQTAHQFLVVGIGFTALLLQGVNIFVSRDQPQGPNGLMEFLFNSRRSGALGVFLIVGITILAFRSVQPVPWGLVAYGRFLPTYGTRLAPGILSKEDSRSVATGDGGPDIFCHYIGEGMNGSIAVTRWASGAKNFHSAGKVQASSDPRDMRLQRMLGHLSAIVHKKPESVLVVACGAGVTAGTFVTHPEVKRIVICDIEPLVPSVVAPMFATENFNVVEDPRTEIVNDDGRHFIRTTPEKFDIITSDPIDPWVKGCAALNTVEYYEMCKARLKPGGVMSLWVPLYESNPETVKSILATFFQVFPNGTVWSNEADGEGYDAVLLGQVEPTQINLDQLQTRLNESNHNRVLQSLSAVGFRSAPDLLSTYAGQAPDLRDWMKGAQINTDRNLRLQYLAGWSANSFIAPEILRGVLHYYSFPTNLFQGSDASIRLLKSQLSRAR